MKYALIFSLALLIILNSCNETGHGIDLPGPGTKYPTKLNTRWEYNTTTTVEYYDTTGNISHTEILEPGNTVVQIIKINDTLGLYNKLIKFETYDLSTPASRSFHWYDNTDSGFASIAYSNAGSSQWVLPKIIGKRYLTFEELKDLINSPEQNFFSLPSEIILDSILFYGIPRKALAYPLEVNKRWIELVLPFYRERYVDRIVNVNFNGQSINCYEIKVDWPGLKIEFNDFVSLTHGLVRREILADSIMITDPIHPDSGSFGKVSTYSNLVRINQ